MLTLSGCKDSSTLEITNSSQKSFHNIEVINNEGATLKVEEIPAGVTRTVSLGTKEVGEVEIRSHGDSVVTIKTEGTKGKAELRSIGNQ